VVDLVAMPRRKRTRKNRNLSYECPDCGGPLASSIINFGDEMPEHDLEASFEWAEQANLQFRDEKVGELLPALLAQVKAG
jgi:NAD-dependent SIR2 family protein deacetylase